MDETGSRRVAQADVVQKGEEEMTPIDQASAWLDKQSGAVSGANGHGETFRVACALVNGFGLSQSEAAMLLDDYNRRCSPPWSEADLRHKLESAIATPHDKPRGFMLKDSRATFTPRRESQVIAKTKTAEYRPDKAAEIPEGLADETRLFLKSVFQEGDGVCICNATLTDDDCEIPDGEGVVLSREEWLRKLDEKDGDMNRIFKSGDRAGIYIRVNPMKVGGSKDADVTAFRHALLEFDNISLSEQWSILQQSDAPCAAVILSGGKSVHAWVKIEAKDRAEFKERVELLYGHFAQYKPDTKNSNPSRFSRLPGCERFDRRQELIALNMGKPSWRDWEVSLYRESRGEIFTGKQLRAFKPSEDKRCIIGKRFLCQGAGALVIGQSGVGKSALAMMMAVHFALGLSMFGIEVAPHLQETGAKIYLVQAENDEGDMAEMYQGVLSGSKINSDRLTQLDANLVMKYDSHHVGYSFVENFQRDLEYHRPQIAIIDPVFSFFGGDISRQQEVSQFFRTWMNPVLHNSGCCALFLHHTNKPPGDPKQRKGWSQIDRAYMGAGSADLVNWARAVMILTQDADGNFDFLIPKRGGRAGMKDLDGKIVTRTKLRHSAVGICWEQIREEVKEKKPKEPKEEGRPKVEFDLNAFLPTLAGRDMSLALIKREAAEFAEVSVKTVERRFWTQIAEWLEPGGSEDLWRLKTSTEPTADEF